MTRNLTGEEILWRHVIGQAIRDVYSDVRERDRVLVWTRTRDFQTVCSLADVDPDNMRENLETLANMSAALCRKYGGMLRRKIVGSD